MRYVCIRLAACLTLGVLFGAGDATAAVIGVDNVHAFDGPANMASGNEYDSFRSTLAAQGHTVVPLNSFGAGDLAGLDAAVFVIPYTQNSSAYSPSEMSAIQSFVSDRAVFISDSGTFSDAGTGSQRPTTFDDNQLLLENIMDFISVGNGGLFVGDNGTGFLPLNMNELVAPYGVSFATSPTNGNGLTVGGFVPHPVTAGVSSVGVDFQLPLTINVPSLDLTFGTGNQNILAVYDTAVPEPSTYVLGAIGFVAFGAVARRRRKRAGK